MLKGDRKIAESGKHTIMGNDEYWQVIFKILRYYSMREMNLPECIFSPLYKYLKDNFYALFSPLGAENSIIIDENLCLQRSHNLVVET